MANAGYRILYCALFLTIIHAFGRVEAVVIIMKNNKSLIFESADARFAPKAPSNGVCGTLLVGNLLSGCASLDNYFKALEGGSCLQFALLSRGGCSFDTKVRHGQDAGFQAVLIADNSANPKLVTMVGNERGIVIPAVFISKVAGEVLTQYINDSLAECWILPAYENTSWLVMVVSFISLTVITAFFIICLLIQQRRSNRQRTRRAKDSRVISYHTVKCLPTTLYDLRCERGGSHDVCAICLEDYAVGAVLRILPCDHRFHCSCIDAWLTNWQAFCPICKQDVRKALSSTESTPLLLGISNPQQLLTPSLQEGSLEASVVGSSNAAPNQQAEACCFSFSRPPLRSSGTAIIAPRPSRHLSLNFLNDLDSMEAFRASPFFSPPPSNHGSAPNMLSSLDSTYGYSHHVGSLPGSLAEPSQNGRYSGFLL